LLIILLVLDVKFCFFPILQALANAASSQQPAMTMHEHNIMTDRFFSAVWSNEFPSTLTLEEALVDLQWSQQLQLAIQDYPKFGFLLPHISPTVDQVPLQWWRLTRLIIAREYKTLLDTSIALQQLVLKLDKLAEFSSPGKSPFQIVLTTEPKTKGWITEDKTTPPIHPSFAQAIADLCNTENLIRNLCLKVAEDRAVLTTLRDDTQVLGYQVAKLDVTDDLEAKRGQALLLAALKPAGVVYDALPQELWQSTSNGDAALADILHKHLVTSRRPHVSALVVYLWHTYSDQVPSWISDLSPWLPVEPLETLIEKTPVTQTRMQFLSRLQLSPQQEESIRNRTIAEEVTPRPNEHRLITSQDILNAWKPALNDTMIAEQDEEEDDDYLDETDTRILLL
jgi:hypothetical protein